MIKLKRRIGSAILAVMMLLSLMPLTALAAGGIVAKIGNQEYDSLQAAVNAAQVNTATTITLVDNITLTEPVTISTNQEITINGDGKTISYDASSCKVVFSAPSGAEVEGIPSGVTLNINNVTFKNTNSSAASSGYAVLVGGNSLSTAVSLNSCSFYNLYTAVYVNQQNSKVNAPKLSITNCTYSSTTYGYSIDETTVGAYKDAVQVTFPAGSNKGVATEKETWKNIAYINDKVVAQGTGALLTAIEAAKTDDTISLAGGEYDVTVTRTGNKTTYGSGFVVAKDNITIQAANPNDKPVIYGFTNEYNAGVDEFSINGQDTVYVSGANVTLKDLVIMPLGGYPGGDGKSFPTKAAEAASGATAFTMTGCETTPNTMTKSGLNGHNMTTSSGNIYVSVNDASISGNSFGAGTTISAADNCSVNVSGNYWGEGVTAADIADKIDGNVIVDTYYTDADMNTTVTIGGTPVATAEQLKNAIANAKDGDTIVLTAGTYELGADECIILNKKLTIQGTGEDTIIKGSGATNYGNGLFTFTGGSEGSVLKDLTIEYTSTGAQRAAVYFDGGFTDGDTNNVTKIQNVNFVGDSSLKDIGSELAITSTYTTGGFIEITGCSFKNFAYAMYFNAIHDLTIADNTIDGTKYNAINIAGDSDKYDCSNIVIRDNVLTNISYAGYDEPAYSSGIRIGQNVSSVTLENNDITMLNGKDGIFFDEGGNAYVATFMNMGNVVRMAVSNENGEVTMPAAPSRAGYSFRGWYDGHNLYAAGQTVQISKDTTFVAQWSDNTPYYTITVKDADNGTVTCYAKSAAKGADVTLTVKADVGYQLDKLTVTDASGNVIDVEKVNNTTYTFVMPGSKVTVEAVFAPTTVEPSDLPFTDVSTSDWFYGAVKFVYENGLMDGVGNNLFAPNATLNRAMAVTILYRLEGAPAVTTDAGFNDVAAGTWYTDAVNWAAANNIVNGVEGNNFDPTGSLTREQMATVLYRYAQYKGADVSASGDLSGFADSANVSSWAADAVKWAVGTGLVNGVEGNALAPQGTSTRAQAATVLMRFVG